jgi:hypothetical protein
MIENQPISVQFQTLQSDKKEPPTNNGKRFLAMLRFDLKRENRLILRAEVGMCLLIMGDEIQHKFSNLFMLFG